MANFRDGFLQQGDALGMRSSVIRVLADQTEVSVGDNKWIKLEGPLSSTVAPGTSSGAGPYDITVTQVNHQLTVGRKVKVTLAVGWTDGAPISGIHTLTAVTSETFTFSVTDDPGASGIVQYEVDADDARIKMLPGSKIGQEIKLQVWNNTKLSLDTSTLVNMPQGWYPSVNDTLSMYWDGSLWQPTAVQVQPQMQDEYYYSETILYQSQITDLHNTPVVLIPGVAEKCIAIEEVKVKLNFGTTPYTGGQGLNIMYVTGGDQDMLVVNPSYVTSSGPAQGRFRTNLYTSLTEWTAGPPARYYQSGLEYSSKGGVGIQVRNGASTDTPTAFAGGDATNSLVIQTKYRLLDVET